MSGCLGDGDFPIPRQEILARCKNGIDTADFIFCWIDSLDCFGTLFELGYAASQSIPIILVYQHKFYNEVLMKTAKLNYREKTFRHEMWFVETAANWMFVFDDPVEAFRMVVEDEYIYYKLHHHQKIKTGLSLAA